MAAAQPKRPITLVHEFHVSESGGATMTLLKNMSKPELRAIVTAGCGAFPHGCSTEVSQIEPAAEVPGVIIAEGERVYITGQVLQQRGDEWWGIYVAPQGYTVCRAALGKASLAVGSIFEAKIASGASPRGLLFHALISNDRESAAGMVHAYFVVQYVPVGTETRLGCMPNGSSPWRCSGGDCQRAQIGFLGDHDAVQSRKPLEH
jgi:hypothetical protein